MTAKARGSLGATPEAWADIVLSTEGTDANIESELFALITAFVGALKLTPDKKEALGQKPSLFMSLSPTLKTKDNFLCLGQKILNLTKGFYVQSQKIKLEDENNINIPMSKLSDDLA